MTESPLSLMPMTTEAAPIYDGHGSAARQMDIFCDIRVPVMAAWGADVASTAMLIEMIEKGERIDNVLFADTGSEKPQTYAFVEIFAKWLADRGVKFALATWPQVNHFPDTGKMVIDRVARDFAGGFFLRSRMEAAAAPRSGRSPRRTSSRSPGGQRSASGQSAAKL